RRVGGDGARAGDPWREDEGEARKGGVDGGDAEQDAECHANHPRGDVGSSRSASPPRVRTAENSAASPLVLGGSVRRPARSPGVHDASPARRAPYPTTSTLAACPRTRPSRASHVTSGASSASASARYAASYAVTFGRRSQMRPRNRWCG